MADFKALLLKLNQNLNTLREREAKHAGNAPLDLLNQINHHEQAIALTEQAIKGELSETAWCEAIKPLLVSLPDEAKFIVNATNIGVVGDNAHIEGGIHFNTSQIDQRDQTVQQQVNVVGDGTTVNVYPMPPGKPLQRPPRAAHFTNRKDELAKLLADLQPGRVVTLCGPGGIGKTALTAEAVRQPEIEARFPDGIIFHTFYGKPDPALAMEHIALSYGEEPRPTPAEAAMRVLAGKQALLILDGTEGVKDLAAVQRITGDCGVLVTSRDRNDAPDPAQRRDVRPLPLDEAMQLLRAFVPTRDDPTARRICELVAGVPLAVQLVGRYLSANEEPAASYLQWLETTPIEALSYGEHREESVTVLLERSLAQVSAAACEVLGVVGQLALAPFGLDPIATALDVSPDHLRKPLGELVRYGLLIVNPRPSDGQSEIRNRYEVSHALIHTYAREKVTPGPEATQRLAAYYTQLAATESAKGLAGYARLDAERAHLLRILAGCVEREEWEAVRGLVWAVGGQGGYLDILGYYTDWQTSLKVGIKAAQQLNKRWDEGGFLTLLGNASSSIGQVEKSLEFYKQALAISRDIGDKQREGQDLGNLGNAYRDLGQVDQAIGYYEQALVISREIGDRRGEGNRLGNLGNAYSDLGQVDQAIGSYEQALVIAREIGDRRGEGADLGNLGTAYLDLGQVDQAIGYYEQALVISREIGDRRGEGNRLGNLGNAYSDLGQVDKVIGYYEQALVIAREIGDRRNEGNWLGNLGLAYSALGQVDKAKTCWLQSLAIFEKIKSPHANLVRGWLTELGEENS